VSDKLDKFFSLEVEKPSQILQMTDLILFTRKPFQNSWWLIVSMSVLKVFQHEESVKWWNILCRTSAWSTAQRHLSTSVFRNTALLSVAKGPCYSKTGLSLCCGIFMGFFSPASTDTKGRK